MRQFLLLLVVASVMAIAACGGGDDASTATQEPVGTGGAGTTPADLPQPAPKPDGPKGETVKVNNHPEFGKMLTDGKGLTLYLFTKETGPEADCYGDCATAWPPLLTKGEPQAGAGVEANGLGTTKRTDGATQVTYKGHPLYYYVDEDEPGEVLCQDVVEFGGTWLIVAPDGSPIQ